MAKSKAPKPPPTRKPPEKAAKEPIAMSAAERYEHYKAKFKKHAPAPPIGEQPA